MANSRAIEDNGVQPPETIKNLRDAGCLRVAWPDGLVKDLPFRRVREECPCAHCIHELTGARLIDPDSIPHDIHAVELQLVGSYALRITWSDGHNTGLFTWDYLRELAEDVGDASV